MYLPNIAQNWMTFQKTSVYNTMKTIEMVQYQNEEILRTLMEYYPFSQTGRKVFDDWLQVIQNSRNEYITAVENYLTDIEGLFYPPETEKSQEISTKSTKQAKNSGSSKAKSQEKSSGTEKAKESSESQTTSSTVNKETEGSKKGAAEKGSGKSNGKESSPMTA